MASITNYDLFVFNLNWGELLVNPESPIENPRPATAVCWMCILQIQLFILYITGTFSNSSSYENQNNPASIRDTYLLCYQWYQTYFCWYQWEAREFIHWVVQAVTCNRWISVETTRSEASGECKMQSLESKGYFELLSIKVT